MALDRQERRVRGPATFSVDADKAITRATSATRDSVRLVRFAGFPVQSDDGLRSQSHGLRNQIAGCRL